MENEKEREKEIERKKHIEHYLKIMEESGVAPHTPPDFERTTADLLVECLEQEGVKYIFGIPGEENLDLMNAIEKSSIQFITTRHEQGAAFMADVYGRLTGKTGVCLSTLGPGATNLVTGVADANLDGAPVLAITGQVATDRMHLTAHQYLDLEKVFEPITKRTKQILRPDTVPESVLQHRHQIVRLFNPIALASHDFRQFYKVRVRKIRIAGRSKVFHLLPFNQPVTAVI